MEFPEPLRGQFKPLRMLGQGGFGAVWLAEQIALERQVALKILNADLVDTPEQVTRFQDEARLTASLRHPGVVRLLDHGLAGGRPWMAFELVNGSSLRAWVERGPAPWRQVLEVGRQVALALEEARRGGVIHRDIKPDNILQAGPAEFKVADFGIGKWAGNHTKTAAGVILGTPAYISPQQVRGLLPEHQSDLYALGVTLYELLAGHTPFREDNPVLMLERHLTAEVPRLRDALPGLPEGVERLVLRLLSKDREDRFDTAGELAEHIAGLLAPRKSGATRALARPAVAVKPRGWPLWPLAVAAAVAIAALAWRKPETQVAVPVPVPSVRATPAAQPAVVADLASRAVRAFVDGHELAAKSPNDALTTAFDAGTARANLAALAPLVDRFTDLLSRWRNYDGPDEDVMYACQIAGESVTLAARVTLRCAMVNPSTALGVAKSPATRSLGALVLELRRLKDAPRLAQRALHAELTPAIELLAGGGAPIRLTPEPIVAGRETALGMLAPLDRDDRPHLFMLLATLECRLAVDRSDAHQDAKAADRARLMPLALEARRRVTRRGARAVAVLKSLSALPFRDWIFDRLFQDVAPMMEFEGATDADALAAMGALEELATQTWARQASLRPLDKSNYFAVLWAGRWLPRVPPHKYPTLRAAFARATEPAEREAQLPHR